MMIQIIICSRSQSQSDNSRKYMKGLTASIKTKDDDAYNIMSSFVVALKIIGLMTYDQRIQHPLRPKMTMQIIMPSCLLNIWGQPESLSSLLFKTPKFPTCCCFLFTNWSTWSLSHVVQYMRPKLYYSSNEAT